MWSRIPAANNALSRGKPPRDKMFMSTPEHERVKCGVDAVMPNTNSTPPQIPKMSEEFIDVTQVSGDTKQPRSGSIKQTAVGSSSDGNSGSFRHEGEEKKKLQLQSQPQSQPPPQKAQTQPLHGGGLKGQIEGKKLEDAYVMKEVNYDENNMNTNKASLNGIRSQHVLDEAVNTSNKNAELHGMDPKNFMDAANHAMHKNKHNNKSSDSNDSSSDNRHDMKEKTQQEILKENKKFQNHKEAVLDELEEKFEEERDDSCTKFCKQWGETMVFTSVAVLFTAVGTIFAVKKMY